MLELNNLSVTGFEPSRLRTKLSHEKSKMLISYYSYLLLSNSFFGMEWLIFRYLHCRSEMLQAISQLVHSCRSLRTSPPPAIAGTQAKLLHDDLQRCGRISQVRFMPLALNLVVSFKLFSGLT